MSSFAGIKIDMEKMNIKYLISSSNKCIQGMAGVSFVICNKDTLNKTKYIKPRNMYLNLYKQYEYFKENNQMRFTPPVQVLYALKKACLLYTSLAILENELKEDFILLESDILYEVYGLIKTINFEGQDCVLLSGKTNSGDECYVEVRDDNLYKISKIRTDIEEIYGELVGISKISLNLYREMIKAYRSKVSDVYYDNNLGEEIRKYDYENAIVDARCV